MTDLRSWSLAGAKVAPHDIMFLEGERKQVTVLFADVRGSTQLIELLDPEAAMNQLDPAVNAMVEGVERFGGIISRLLGDGIMALFGVPAAFEDHAVRACLAARTMIDAVADLNRPDLEIRVGIDSGEVVIRKTGRGSSDYDATGVIAHIASRLEQYATPGTALLTGRTARLARGYVDLATVGPVILKGISQPLEAYRLLSAEPRASWEARQSTHTLNRFVGREEELSQLSAALERADSGPGQVVTIVGEAGLGKSRLVHEFLSAQRDRSWHVLSVAAVSHATGAPFYLTAELLRSWLAVVPTDRRAEVKHKLTRTLALIDPEGRADVSPLQSLLELPVVDEEWLRLSPLIRRNRTLSSLRTILLNEARLQPLIVIVEDYHWADTPSAQLLDVIVRNLDTAKLLMILTTRPDRRVPWAGIDNSLELHLPPLDRENADLLLRELIGGEAELEPVRRQVLVRAGGIPLFIEEIGRSLLESGVADDAGDSQSIKALSDENIPASVQAIIATRIDRLPPRARALLHVASVIGNDVPLNLLQAVADVPRQDLERDLDDLRSAKFLYELTGSMDTVLTFRHGLIQTVAYEEMLRKHRRDLHAKVMKAIESMFAHRLDELTERLSDHALRGEVWKAAVAYAVKAGDRAVERGAWREAIAFFDRAIEALTHLPRTPETSRLSIEARLRLRVALPGVADLPRIARCLDEARELAEELGDRMRLAEIDTSSCLTQTKMGRLSQAVKSGRRGYAQSQDLKDSVRLLNSSFALAQAYWYQGEFRRSEELIAERLPEIRGDLRFRQTGTTGTASLLSLVCLAKTFAITGRCEQAFEVIAEAYQIADETRKPFDLSYCGVGRGFCHLLHNNPWGAVKDLEQAISLARSADIALLIPSSARYLGRAYVLSGRLQEAIEILGEAIDRTKATGLLGMQLWSAAALALAQIFVSPDEAKGTLMATFEAARRSGFRPLEAHLMHLIGIFLARSLGQEQDSAESWYRQAIQLADELGMVPEAAGARRDLDQLPQSPKYQ